MSSFRNFENEITLHKLNYIDLGVLLHSRFSCTTITDFISQEIRRRMVEVITIIVDENDTVSKYTTMIIYLRGCFCGSKSRTVFFDLTEVKDESAKGLKKALIDDFMLHSIPEKILNDCLIGFIADGASTMLGRGSGLSIHWKRVSPTLLFGTTLLIDFN